MHDDIGDIERANLRFRQVVEAAPTAMVMVNKRGIIEMVNTQTELIFGYSRDELLGQLIDILLPERFRHQHPQHRDSFFLTSVRAPWELAGTCLAAARTAVSFP